MFEVYMVLNRRNLWFSFRTARRKCALEKLQWRCSRWRLWTPLGNVRTAGYLSTGIQQNTENKNPNTSLALPVSDPHTHSTNTPRARPVPHALLPTSPPTPHPPRPPHQIKRNQTLSLHLLPHTHSHRHTVITTVNSSDTASNRVSHSHSHNFRFCHGRQQQCLSWSESQTQKGRDRATVARWSRYQSHCCPIFADSTPKTMRRNAFHGAHFVFTGCQTPSFLYGTVRRVI